MVCESGFVNHGFFHGSDWLVVEMLGSPVAVPFVKRSWLTTGWWLGYPMYPHFSKPPYTHIYIYMYTDIYNINITCTCNEEYVWARSIYSQATGNIRYDLSTGDWIPPWNTAVQSGSGKKWEYNLEVCCGLTLCFPIGGYFCKNWEMVELIFQAWWYGTMIRISLF